MEFNRMIEELEEYKIKGEKETTWKKINILFTEINGFIKTAPTDKVFHLNKYAKFYFTIVNSQRSILVGTTVRLLISFAKILGSENVYFYEYLRESLAVCGKANNIIYKYGNMLLDELLRQEQFSEKVKCRNLIIEKANNLNKKLRFSVFKALLAHRELYKNGEYDQLIDSGRTDKAVEIRNLFKNIKVEDKKEVEIQKVIRPSLLRRQIQPKCSPAPKKICQEINEIKNSEDDIFTPSRLKQYLDKYTKVTKMDSIVFEPKKEIIKAEKVEDMNKNFFTDRVEEDLAVTTDKDEASIVKEELPNEDLAVVNEELPIAKEELLIEKESPIAKEEQLPNEEQHTVKENSFAFKGQEKTTDDQTISILDDLTEISYGRNSSMLRESRSMTTTICDDSINNRTDDQLIREPSNPFFQNKSNLNGTMKVDESIVEGNERVIIDFDDNMPLFDKEAKKTLDELLKKEINPDLFNQKISIKKNNAKIKLPFQPNKFKGLSLIENDFEVNDRKSEIIPFDALKEEDSSFSEENIKKLSKSLNDLSVENKSIHIDSTEGNIERSDRSFFSQFSIPELIDFEE